MNTNQGEIILAERTADDRSIRSILREWGYKESEIQRFLSEPRVDQKQDQRPKTTEQMNMMPDSIF